MTPEERNTVIEEVAAHVEQARVCGRKYHFWGAFWTHFNDPFPKRDVIAIYIRNLKTETPKWASESHV